jgi:hypothetical protein
MLATLMDLESGAVTPKRKWSYPWKAMTPKLQQDRMGLVRLPGLVPQHSHSTNLISKFLSMRERIKFQLYTLPL